MFQGQKGMSLVQVMVALGLMSVIGLGVAELMVTSAKVNQRSDIKLSQLMILNELQSIISNENACGETITSFPQAQQFSFAQANGNGWDIDFNIGGKVIQTGTEITSGLSISRLFYRLDQNVTQPVSSDATANTATYLGQVFIEYQTDGPIIGGQIKDKAVGSMFLTINTNNNTAMGCAKEPDTAISEICRDLGGSYTNGSCSGYQFANCPNDGLNHGQSTTTSFTNNGNECRRSRMCLDGNMVETSNFCVSGTSNTTIIQQPTCSAGFTWNGNQCLPVTCFTPETQISMFDGSKKPISKVKLGDYVIGEDGAINVVYDIEAVALGERKLYSFNGKTPHFITEEHPVKTLNLNTGEKDWKSFNPIKTLEEHSILDRDHLFNLNPQPLSPSDILVKIDLQNQGLKYQYERLDYYTSRPDDFDLTVYNLRLKAAPGSPFDDKDDRSNTYIANGYLVHNK